MHSSRPYWLAFFAALVAASAAWAGPTTDVVVSPDSVSNSSLFLAQGETGTWKLKPATGYKIVSSDYVGNPDNSILGGSNPNYQATLGPTQPAGILSATVKGKLKPLNPPGAGGVAQTKKLEFTVNMAVNKVNITQDKDLWWFNGEQPAGYGLMVTLTAVGQTTGTFEWSMIAGQDMATFVNGGQTGATLTKTNNNTMQIKGLKASTALSDVTVKLKLNGQAVAIHGLTVYAPTKMKLVADIPFIVNPKDVASGVAFFTTYEFYLLDQADRVVKNLPVNETITNVVKDIQNTSWQLQAFRAGGTDNWGIITDDYGYPESEYDQTALSNATPPMLNPNAQGANTKVIHCTQKYFAGSNQAGKGVLVKTHTLQFYRGKARQE